MLVTLHFEQCNVASNFACTLKGITVAEVRYLKDTEARIPGYTEQFCVDHVGYVVTQAYEQLCELLFYIKNPEHEKLICEAIGLLHAVIAD